MRTLRKAIKVTVVEKGKWEEEIDEFLLSYCTTPHTTTKTAPLSLLFRGKFKS